MYRSCLDCCRESYFQKIETTSAETIDFSIDPGYANLAITNTTLKYTFCINFVNQKDFYDNLKSVLFEYIIPQKLLTNKKVCVKMERQHKIRNARLEYFIYGLLKSCENICVKLVCARNKKNEAKILFNFEYAKINSKKKFLGLKTTCKNLFDFLTNDWNFLVFNFREKKFIASTSIYSIGNRFDNFIDTLLIR